MRRSTRLLAIGATLFAASAAGAQMTGPTQICGPGNIYCYAFRTALGPTNGAGVALFSLWLQNTTGSSFISSINGVTLASTFPGTGPLDLVVGTTPGQLGVPEGNVRSGLATHGTRDDCSLSFCTVVLLQWDLTNGIVGCNNPYGAISFAYQTCPQQGLDGWVRIDYDLTVTAGGPTPVPVTVDDFNWWLDVTGAPAPTTTPEPATLALLVPGLVGIVAVRRRR